MTKRQSGSVPAVAADGGFTLLELLTVLGITAIALAVSLPNISAFQTSGRSRPLAAIIATELKRVHVSAMATGTPVSFILDGRSGRYWVEGSDRAGHLPRGTSVSLIMQREPHKASGERRITFYPDGSATAGQLIVEDFKGQKIILDINPITGTVTQHAAAR